MSQKIPISILNIKHTPFALTINEAPDIEDQKIVKEVLQYIDNILNIRKADFYYTTILYPGVENYETLQNVMEPIISKLHNLVINGLIDPNGTKWKIEPYFSSTKKDIGNRDKIHKIEKNMNQIHKSENQFDDNIKRIISVEMQRISVKFHFWQDHITQSWSYISLMGGDKEIVLQNFNFKVLFNIECANLINQL
ncbi:hypothetical protein GLOIN_2v1785980 [Rhizophagus irregularis DAOM 181602=DAOM 197198]|nr:hypothetical protein GLOIN_2v1785980 [Rhizophagus irregularis DAOM 181602=DAOM 197198]